MIEFKAQSIQGADNRMLPCIFPIRPPVLKLSIFFFLGDLCEFSYMGKFDGQVLSYDLGVHFFYNQ